MRNALHTDNLELEREMPQDYTVLLGAEQVQRAAAAINGAATEMTRAANQLDEALRLQRAFMDDWLERYKAALASQDDSVMEELHIVFDGPPGPTAGRFVEVENAEGKSISVGRWEQHGNYWHLILAAYHAGGE